MSLLQMSFSGAVLVLAIITVRSLGMNRLPKKTFLALWWVALARLLAPYSLPSPFSAYALFQRDASRAAGAGGALVLVPRAVQGPLSPSAGAAANGGALWRAVWLIGALACAAFFAAAYLRCRAEFRTALPVDSALTRAFLPERPAWRAVAVRQSDRVGAPLTYGVLRPVILLPKKTDWRDETALRCVFAHELVHIRRCDALTKLLLAAAVCVHWFNPFVWCMFALANRDIELACDEAAVRQLGGDARAMYARALIRMEEAKRGFAPFCSNFSKNAIEERIVAIMKTKKTTAISLILAVLLVLGTATAFATSAPEESAAKDAPSSDNGALTPGAVENVYAIGVEAEKLTDCTVISYVSPDDGTTFVSLDNGESYVSMTPEELEKYLASPDVEWWTAEDYAAWLENEKVELQKLLGEKGWTGGRGDFVWTQKLIDETIALYEETLKGIQNGLKVSKSIDGVEDGDMMISYNPNDISTTGETKTGTFTITG